MSYQRIDRISEQVRREVDRIIRERLSDPRIRGTFSVTRAEVTRDLRYAKIYVSILEEADRAPMMAALKKAAGFVRHELGQSMIIRYAPEILFERITTSNTASISHLCSSRCARRKKRTMNQATVRNNPDPRQQVLSAVQAADSVLLFCHVSPDGDTLGSALALRLRLTAMGKSVRLLVDGEVPSNLAFLPAWARWRDRRPCRSG